MNHIFVFGSPAHWIYGFSGVPLGFCPCRFPVQLRQRKPACKATRTWLTALSDRRCVWCCYINWNLQRPWQDTHGHRVDSASTPCWKFPATGCKIMWISLAENEQSPRRFFLQGGFEQINEFLADSINEVPASPSSHVPLPVTTNNFETPHLLISWLLHLPSCCFIWPSWRCWTNSVSNSLETFQAWRARWRLGCRPVGFGRARSPCKTVQNLYAKHWPCWDFRQGRRWEQEASVFDVWREVRPQHGRL